MDTLTLSPPHPHTPTPTQDLTVVFPKRRLSGLVHSGVQCSPLQKKVHQQKNCALPKVLSAKVVLSPKCSPFNQCSPRSALLKVLCAPIVLSSKCSSQKKCSSPKCSPSKKCSPKRSFRKFALSKCFPPEKTVSEQVRFEKSNSKIFLGYSYFPSSKISFRVAISKKIVPTFAFSKAVFRKNCRH